MSDEFDAYDLSEFTDDDLAAIDVDLARARLASPVSPAIRTAVERTSPFRRFLSWKKHLAVTDLVSPLWCEVQYEYGLYGKRYKPLQLRPSTFTSKDGNQIRVHQQVAHANDRRLKRGKSVHRALEDELRPDRIVVHVVSEEERFGLRLVQLIDGFNELVSNGITRELPVFAITHAQVVLGVIDEVLWSPFTQGTQDQVISPKSPSNAPLDSPPEKKKQRLQETISFAADAPPRTSAMVTDSAASTCIPDDLYELRIVDYKTRRSSIIPLDEDSLSPRLQLMLYHRMLSSLLEPETFDFDLLWSRLNLDPTKPFSTKFLKDVDWERRWVDPTDCSVHLNRLVSEWTFTVQRKCSGLVGVSRQLQIVYRRSVFVAKRRRKAKDKATQTIDVDGSLETLVLQEELDLARAIEESLGKMGHEQVDQHHVAQGVEQVGTSSVCRTSSVSNDAERTDATLALAIQQSLLTCARTTVPADKMLDDGGNPCLDQSSPTLASNLDDAVETSPIIGTKEFRMNDDELDTHLADVLRWWFGARPARGVDVHQTHRCFTCEYQDSCEWREQKAREAVALAVERRDDTNSVWPTTPDIG